MRAPGPTRSRSLLRFYWDGLGPMSWVAGIVLVGNGRRRWLCYWDELESYRALGAIEPWDDPLAVSGTLRRILARNGTSFGVTVFRSLPGETTNRVAPTSHLRVDVPVDVAIAAKSSIRSTPAASATSGLPERRLQAGEVGGAEDEAVPRRDVDEIEVDTGVCNLSCQVGKDARPILGLDHDHLALAAHGELRDRQRVPGGFGVRNEDVQLDLVGRPDARRGRQVHAGVADRGRDAGQ
jgi:hypothetical protein